MTLILKPDLDIVKMYHHTKNKVSISTGSKVIAQTDTHTHRHTHRHDENITSTAYAGGNNNTIFSAVSLFLCGNGPLCPVSTERKQLVIAIS